MSNNDPNVNPPTVASTPDMTTRDGWMTLVQAVIGLLGLVGVALPPIFTNQAVLQQIISVGFIVVPFIIQVYDRVVTKPKQIHAAAVMSARMNSPRRLKYEHNVPAGV